MIYLSHPKFDFEDVDIIDGGIVGVCFDPIRDNFPIGYVPGFLDVPVNAESIINKFPESISLYWAKNRTQSVSLGFVREDGAEFAIRFLKHTVFSPNGFGEILGYWKDIIWPREINYTDRIIRVQSKLEHDRQEYAKFVEWLVFQSENLP